MPKKSLLVQVHSEYDRLEFSEGEIQSLVNFLDNREDVSIPSGELSIAFVDDPKIASIHKDFMDDPTPTDVITFPDDPEMESAGEICISVDHAISTAQDLQLPFIEELTLYLVHGCLHLSGYDDIDPKDREIMREMEQKCMSALKDAQLLPGFKLND